MKAVVFVEEYKELVDAVKQNPRRLPELLDVLAVSPEHYRTILEQYFGPFVNYLVLMDEQTSAVQKAAITGMKASAIGQYRQRLKAKIPTDAG